MVFSYFAGNKQLNQCLFPAKCVYQVFAGNADKRHRGGVSEALTVFRIPSEGAKEPKEIGKVGKTILKSTPKGWNWEVTSVKGCQ